MKKILLGLAIVFTVALPITAALADPPTSPPGQDECDGGNSDHTCVPDPQPTNGQDCDEHGNNGGVNENHCLTTTTATTTTLPTTTSTVTTQTSTTTTVTEPPTTTTQPPSTTVTQPPVTTTTVVGTTTAQPPTNGGPGNGGPSDPAAGGPGKLAFTGVEDIVPWTIVTLFLLILGSGLFWLGNRKASR